MKQFICIILLAFPFFSFTQSKMQGSRLYFENNKFVLNDSQSKKLEVFYNDKILEKEVEKIEVIGYADSLGSRAYNLNLSKNRAISVFRYLIKRGVSTNVIQYYFLGEENPVFLTEKNRLVEVRVYYNETSNKGENGLGEKNYKPVKFENDTTLVFEKGTKIEITAETFYPLKIKDVKFEVAEIFSLCDMLKYNTTTRTESGDCLLSAGMIYMKATYDGVEIQPNKEKYVRVKIPTLGGVVDTAMSIYASVKNDSGEVVWKKMESKLSYEKEGEKYFLFDTDTIYNFNLDKPLGILCQKTGPVIKVPRFNDLFITQMYPNENYLAIAEKKTKSLYALDELKFEMKPFLVIIGYDKYGFPFVAEGNLKNLKHRKRKNVYVVKKKYFRALHADFDSGNTPRNDMCEYLDSMTFDE